MKVKDEMRTQSPEAQNPENSPGRRRRGLALMLLVSLTAFFLGGCITLLVVNRLLNNQLDGYAAAQNMAAASTLLDLMDDLLLFNVIYGGVLLGLVLVTAGVGVWLMTRSRLWRYGVILLCVVIFVVLAGMGLLRGRAVPVVPPTTPTPVGWDRLGHSHSVDWWYLR